MKVIFSSSLEDNKEVVKEILSYAGDLKIIAFYGEMGAGKTTLIKELCDQLHVLDTVSSPSFAIVNEYSTCHFGRVYHFDFYRISSMSEVYDIGYEEYFYSGDYCFIEWAERVQALLPDYYLKVDMEVINEKQRKISLNRYRRSLL